MAKLIPWYLVICFISACQTAPPHTLSNSCNQKFADNWQVAGRIKVISDKKTAVSFFWQQQGQEFDVVLLGVFGEQLAQVKGTVEHAQVALGTQVPIVTDNIANTLYEHTRWHFPVAQLKFWLTVRAASSNFTAEYSSNGCFSQITEQGYTIFYPSVYTQDKAVLASKIIAVKDDIELHFSLSNWQLEQGAP